MFGTSSLSDHGKTKPVYPGVHFQTQTSCHMGCFQVERWWQEVSWMLTGILSLLPRLMMVQLATMTCCASTAATETTQTKTKLELMLLAFEFPWIINLVKRIRVWETVLLRSLSASEFNYLVWHHLAKSAKQVMSYCFYFKLCALIRLHPGRGFNAQRGVTVCPVCPLWQTVDSNATMCIAVAQRHLKKTKAHRATKLELLRNYLIAHYS